ncbi:MAG: DUF1669 domain-containing protein [Candidatus Hydrogenedentes bacterium]|nr:DUF1669 domain-containing protein [Candidatus Hydrogenedentota bacterium]
MKRRRRLLVLALVLAFVLVAYGLLGSGRAGLTVPQRLKETAATVRQSLSAGAARLFTRTSSDARTPGESTVTPHIAVYFAPAPLETPGGVDDALLTFLQGAKKSLFCAFYELQWNEAAKVLITQHRAGVAVKIVSDSDYAAREAVQLCMDAGIPVVVDKRNAFMHNKFCVADGERVWTGSTNVTQNCLYRNDNNALMIASPQIAANYSAEFGEMFADGKFGPRSPKSTAYPVVVVDGISIECYFAPEDKVQKEIVSEIDAAGENVDVMAFSFTADDIAEALARRMDKGVKVRALFETRNASSQYSDDDFLARQGAQVVMDRNSNTMHNKVIIIDGETVITGSYNFSKAAEKDNDENALIVHSPEVAKRYTQQFERLIK